MSPADSVKVEVEILISIKEKSFGLLNKYLSEIKDNKVQIIFK